ncbi:hypothetical protein EWM64_g9086 [Hericium alpestre]|uniref:Uncharacterized protein n=1 Tax=Hericium alpestre TaxID=135208 RepID=A0A4Y9ZJF1_9AGAM|nr:hypothetical protein EWM64_g9086 [Hericium alpestre]
MLHQLYQGVLKHILSWCKKMLTSVELDEHIRRLPPTFGVQHFKNGFLALAQISGTERKNMAKILLAYLVGWVPNAMLIAIRSILDFIYIAQYPTQDEITLGYLEKALDDFYQHCNVFKQLRIHKDFDIPKFHSLVHYVKSIQLFGTTDNYNTEMFEQFHIDFAKKAWQASNHQDKRPQMTQWLSRREKVAMFDEFLLQTKDSPSVDDGWPPRKSKPAIQIVNRPPRPKVAIITIEQEHNAPFFSLSLKQYINQFLPSSEKATR